MRRKLQLPLIAAAILLIAGLLAAIPVTSSANPNLDQLNNQLSQQQSEQQNLQNAISNLDGLINGLDSQISLVESRESAVRAQLATDRAQLAATRKALAKERRLVALLKARLARARTLLANQLISNYEGNQPDVVGVVLDSRGFNELLENLRYLHDAEHQQQSLISITTAAKQAADTAEARLAKLEATRKRITDAAAEEAHALANMDALLHSKEAALQSARSAKESALAASKSRGAALQSQINQIQAQQAAARTGGAERGQRVRSDGRFARPERWLGDPLGDRELRVRRPELPPQLRRRLGLLPDHSQHLGRVRRHRTGGLPRAQVRAGRGRGADLGRLGPQRLGLRPDRRDYLGPAISRPDGPAWPHGCRAPARPKPTPRGHRLTS